MACCRVLVENWITDIVFIRAESGMDPRANVIHTHTPSRTRTHTHKKDYVYSHSCIASLHISSLYENRTYNNLPGSTVIKKKIKKIKRTKEEERWNQTSCNVQSQLTTTVPELTGKTLTEPDIHTVTRV